MKFQSSNSVRYDHLATRNNGKLECIRTWEGRNNRALNETEQRGAFDVYSSPNVIKIIKSKKVKWDGHVARMGDNRHAYRF